LDGARSARAGPGASVAPPSLVAPLLSPDDAGPVTAAREALAIARERGYRMLVGTALTALAAAELRRADVELGVVAELADEALAVHTETGHRLGAARTHLIAAAAAGRDTAAGLTHSRQAEQLFAAIGAPLALHTASLPGR
jgi:hypothetical protein